MNRTDRLLAMVLELREREWTRGAALAGRYEVSLRTIYRDMLALSEAGVPIISAAGRGYQLMPGYFLPPLHFTADEASLLSFGLDLARGAFDAGSSNAAETAGQKLRAALPEPRRLELDMLRQRTRLIADPPAAGPLTELRRALLERRVVNFEYHKPGSVPATRRAQPQTLARVDGVWLLRALDLERQAARTFRVDRIERLHLSGEHFEHAQELPPAPDSEPRQTFLVWFPAALARPLRERPSFFQTEEAQEVPDGLRVRLSSRDVASVLPWVLSWGGAARVLESAELRDAVRAQARAMLERC